VRRLHHRHLHAEVSPISFAGSPSDFRTLVASETNKWAGVVKFAGIGAE